MYIIDVKDKTSKKIPETTFSEIGLKERNDIQEWIANNPGILEYSQDLLIIQKEFDGFADTDRRLDLLALDASGNLVIIENKRDDTGKDVVWQAINYASFCSTLKQEDVIEIYAKYLAKYKLEGSAEQDIADFFGNENIKYPADDQKIISVAREFRKEVLSTAQWLNTKGIETTCIKLTPHVYNGEVFLDVDRILPQEEMKDYTLKLAEKAQDSIQQSRNKSRAEQRNTEFWNFFFNKFDTKGTVFENITTVTTNSYIGAASGFLKRAYFNFVISEKYARVELYIDRAAAEENKRIFDAFYSKRDEIESDVGEYTLEWNRLDNRRASRINIHKDIESMDNREIWDSVAEFLKDAMEKLIAATKKHSAVVNK